MGKNLFKMSVPTMGVSGNWGESCELGSQTSLRNVVGHSRSSFCDSLIYVHSTFDFYFKCTNFESES